MDKKKVVETLFDKKVIKILRLFINNSDNQYYLREISRLTKVSPASTHRILTSMESLSILEAIKTKHLKTYVLNKKNASIFTDLFDDDKTAIEEFVEFTKRIDSVQKVIKHGEEAKGKANLLILANSLDQEILRKKAIEIKQKYRFNIIFLVLGPGQFEQFEEMGLYPGQKETLYSK